VTVKQPQVEQEARRKAYFIVATNAWTLPSSLIKNS
jgi:hypothetical protein